MDHGEEEVHGGGRVSVVGYVAAGWITLLILFLVYMLIRIREEEKKK